MCGSVLIATAKRGDGDQILMTDFAASSPALCFVDNKKDAM